MVIAKEYGDEYRLKAINMVSELRNRVGHENMMWITYRSNGLVERTLCKACMTEEVKVGINYTVVKIHFDNGSDHLTALCDSCARSDMSLEKIKEIYTLDLAGWLMEEAMLPSSFPIGINWEPLVNRNPTSWSLLN